MRMGMEEVGVKACHQVGILDRLLDSAPLFLTGNTDTVYVSGILDLERDGPTIVEIPPGCGPTTVNDAWFRFITDMGRPGLDRGDGGKYLIVREGVHTIHENDVSFFDELDAVLQRESLGVIDPEIRGLLALHRDQQGHPVRA